MFIVLKLLGMACMWFVVPIATGFAAVQIFGKEKKNIIYCYLLGMTILFALFYVVARIAILQELSLSVLTQIWMVVMVALILVAVVMLFRRRKEIKILPLQKQRPCLVDKKSMLLGAAVLLLLTVISVAFVPVSQEDYTVSSVLTMYTTDTLYGYSPMTGRSVLLSVEKDRLEQMAKSPWEAYYAMCIVMSKINPAKFIHLVLPFFIFPVYFFVYVAWGIYLFPGEKNKNYLFWLVIWLLYSIPLFSDKAFYFGIFQNGWNGESIFFLALLPWVVLQLIGEKKEVRGFEEFATAPMIITYVVSALAGQLLYEKGFFMVTFAWVAVLVMTGVMRWKNGSSI